MRAPNRGINPGATRKLLPLNMRELRALTNVIRLFCLLPFVTGAADLFGGTDILVSAGAILPRNVAFDPVLNSQIKFWGAIWFGYGIILWWTSYDVRARSTVLRLLLATLLLSGLGRALSVVQFGWASPALTFAMSVEIAGSIGLLIWHWRACRRDR